MDCVLERESRESEMVKFFSSIFIEVSIYGCDWGEKRRLEVTSVAGVVAEGGRKRAAHLDRASWLGFHGYFRHSSWLGAGRSG